MCAQNGPWDLANGREQHVQLRPSIPTIGVCQLGSEVLMAVTANNTVFCEVASFGCCKTGVSEERIASIIYLTRIGELGTTLAVTSD
jgi:hypothetical protein